MTAGATLVAGGPGCGKTMFGMEFLLRGASEGEPGVLFALEERERDITLNAKTLGFDLAKLVADDRLRVDDICIDAAGQTEVGAWNLDALLTRMEGEIAAIGAKHVVIDTIETLFSAFDDHARLRREIVKLVRRLKKLELTAVITAKSGEGSLTRRGVEEYVSDCVILLDHRIDEQVSTRRLRIVKYRGSSHGTDEYPFLIDAQGLSIVPITSVSLDYEVAEETLSSGVPDLDRMLDGRGYFTRQHGAAERHGRRRDQKPRRRALRRRRAAQGDDDGHGAARCARADGKAARASGALAPRSDC